MWISWFSRYKGNTIIRNSTYGGLQFFVSTLLLLIFTPLLLKTMGTTGYGLWTLANSTLGLIGIAEFGFGTAVAKFTSEFADGKNSDALSTVVWTSILAYLILGITLIVPLYIFSPNLAEIFKPSDTVTHSQIVSVMQIMSLGFIPLLFRSGASSIPIGLQRFEIPMWLALGYQIASYSAALLVTLFGGSIEQAVKSTIVVLWLTALLALFISWRMLKSLRVKFYFIWRKDIPRRMLSFSAATGLASLGSKVFNFADKLAVGAVLGLDAVAYYTIIIGIASKILQLSGALTNALMPAVSQWWTAGDFKRVRTHFLKSTGILGVLNLLIAVVLIILSQPLLRLWVGIDFTTHVLVPFRFLIVIYALISMAAPAYHVANGIGTPWINAFASILGGVFTIGSIILFGNKSGLLGVAVANGGYLINLVLIIFVMVSLQKRRVL